MFAVSFGQYSALLTLVLLLRKVQKLNLDNPSMGKKNHPETGFVFGNTASIVSLLLTVHKITHTPVESGAVTHTHTHDRSIAVSKRNKYIVVMDDEQILSGFQCR